MNVFSKSHPETTNASWELIYATDAVNSYTAIFPFAGNISTVLQTHQVKFSWIDTKTKNSLCALAVEWVYIKKSFWYYILWAQ